MENIKKLHHIVEKFEAAEDLYQKHFRFIWNSIELAGDEDIKKRKSHPLSEEKNFEKIVMLTAYLCLAYDALLRFIWDVETCIGQNRNPFKVTLSSFGNIHPEFYKLGCINTLKEMRDIREVCKYGFGPGLAEAKKNRPDVIKASKKSYWNYDLHLEQTDLEKYFSAIKEFTNRVKEVWLHQKIRDEGWDHA